MGKTMRWLKRILGGKGENNDQKLKSNDGEVRDKKRWSFGKPRSSVSVCHYEETKKRCMDLEKHKLYHVEIEIEASIKIQKAFKGHLARKALRALKSLVKLQALVRGYLVRKRMAQRIHRLQSVIRAQAVVTGLKHCRRQSQNANAGLSLFSHKSYERTSCGGKISQPGPNQRQSASHDMYKSGLDTSPKIIEMDTCQLRSRSSRLSTVEPSTHIFSPLHCKTPFRHSISNARRLSQEYGYYSQTTTNTPRCTGFDGNSPVIPAKGTVVNDGILRRVFSRHEQPGYMADTHSSVAKIRDRSQSVPRQRPDETPRRRRVSLDALGPKEGTSIGDVNRITCTPTKERGEKFGSMEYYLDRMW